MAGSKSNKPSVIGKKLTFLSRLISLPVSHPLPSMSRAGACVGVGGLVVVSLLGLLFYRRETRKRLISSVPLHRTASSGSTSEQDPEFGGERYVTQVFKYEELQKATGGFSSSNQLGDGGFGTVYEGICKPHRINVSSLFPPIQSSVCSFVDASTVQEIFVMVARWPSSDCTSTTAGEWSSS